jgi:hypothetical protein
MPSLFFNDIHHFASDSVSAENKKIPRYLSAVACLLMKERIGEEELGEMAGNMIIR